MFNIPNFLTATNLLLGVISIMLSLQGRIDLAVYCMLVAMLLDFLDGFVARLMNQQSEMGKQLDSLADMVSFGVAPGVLVFVMLIMASAVQLSGGLVQDLLFDSVGSSLKFYIDLYFQQLVFGAKPNDVLVFEGWSLILPMVSLFVPFFSLFRLAKFNLDTRQSELFIGLPTPANSLFFMGISLTLWFGVNSSGIGELLAEILIREQVLMTLVVVFSVLLVSEIPLIALKFKNFAFKDNWDKYILVSSSILLVVLLQQFALTFIVLLYLILSVVRFFSFKSKNNEIQS